MNFPNEINQILDHTTTELNQVLDNTVEFMQRYDRGKAQGLINDSLLFVGMLMTPLCEAYRQLESEGYQPTAIYELVINSTTVPKRHCLEPWSPVFSESLQQLISELRSELPEGAQLSSVQVLSLIRRNKDCYVAKLLEREKPRSGKTCLRPMGPVSRNVPGLLLEYGKNLNELAKSHSLDRIAARSTELNRIIHVLERRTKNNPCLVGEPGVGKAIALNTSVLTPNGWISAKDVKIGNQLIGRNGKATNVIGVYPQPVQSMYRISFSDNTYVDINGEHLWQVRPSRSRIDGRGENSWQIMTTKEILDTKLKDQRGRRHWEIPMLTAPVEFELSDIPLPMDPYALGVALGDGKLGDSTKNVRTFKDDFSANVYTDREILEEIGATDIVERTGCWLGKIRIPNELGLRGTRSNNKFIPPQYLIASWQDRLLLLQGLLDTDGSANGRTIIEFSSASMDLAVNVIELVQSLGGTATCSVRTPHFVYREERREGKTSYRVQIKLPEGITPFRLSRKFEHWHAPTKYPVRRFIERITPIDDAESVCFTVDAPDHLFVIEGYVVTHNTAIAEGLAQLIVSQQVPPSMQDKTIISLDIASIIAGCRFRGDFEERFKNILRETIAHGQILLFIDEFHLLIGAGDGEGAIDASNILKPYMARGELKLIGATTLEEYRKKIEKDPALERRLQKVMVDEPTEAAAVEMLLTVRPAYETFHRVQISEEAITAAVKLSARYVADRFLPDKAVDLIDEACVQVKLSGGVAVVPEDIARVVQQWTKIPLAALQQSEGERLAQLEQTLALTVIGQPEPVTKVANSIRRSRSGISDASRPIGSFLFLGSSGTGKTHTAKQLAKCLFDNENAVIRFDMSEYMEKHSVSRLVGSPPGYVGYDEGGQLTERVRQQPYSILLFDEIEKAAPEVFNILLQILDDGRLTDGQGRTVSFRNAVIIMTSNLGSDMAGIINRKAKFGFGESAAPLSDYALLEQNARAEVKDTFRPEFINRLDEIVVFRPLGEPEIRQILDLTIAQFRLRLTEMTIEFSDDALALLAERGYDREYGARPLRRAFQDLVENPLSLSLINHEFLPGDAILADREGDRIVFQKGDYHV
jgi:ATP-dependent Clp protease ATP-binding subunit ClpA